MSNMIDISIRPNARTEIRIDNDDSRVIALDLQDYNIVNRFVDLLISHLYKDYTRGISPTGKVVILAKCCRIHCTTSPYFRGNMLPFIQFQSLCPLL